MVNFHGVDVRIMNEEQAFYLSKLKLKRRIHIAWDLPDIDLTEKLKEVTKYIKPRNLSCYVLVGFNSTIEQDIYRLNRLKELGISPFVQPYRDFNNDRKPHYTKRILHSGLTNIKYLNLVILPTFHHEKDSSANII